MKCKNCDRPAWGLGLCKKDYKKYKYNTDPHYRTQTRNQNKRYLLKYRNRIRRTELTDAQKFRILKAVSKMRNYSISLSFKQYKELVKDRSCFYCGDRLPIKGHGLDRLNNKHGYSIKNSVPCCKFCNKMKLDLDAKEFINHCFYIADNFMKDVNEF